jgi:hypothetical protein
MCGFYPIFEKEPTEEDLNTCKICDKAGHYDQDCVDEIIVKLIDLYPKRTSFDSNDFCNVCMMSGHLDQHHCVFCMNQFNITKENNWNVHDINICPVSYKFMLHVYQNMLACYIYNTNDPAYYPLNYVEILLNPIFNNNRIYYSVDGKIKGVWLYHLYAKRAHIHDKFQFLIISARDKNYKEKVKEFSFGFIENLFESENNTAFFNM